MLRSVRKFLCNRSPDWLNTEVNKNLLQNLSDNISTTDNTKNINSAPLASLSKGGARQRGGIGGWGDLDPSQEQVKPSQIKSDITKHPPLPTDNCSLMMLCPCGTVKGTPHWRRIKQVFIVLDNAPANYTYNQLIKYVRETTGKGCSRKLISKWKKHRRRENHNSRDDLSSNIVSPPTALAQRTNELVLPTQIIQPELSNAYQEMGVNNLQLNQAADNLSNDNSLNRPTLLPVKAWSYLTAAGITIALVGFPIIPFNNNRKSENVAIASVTAPITPLTPTPERIKNRLEPRNIKIELTLSNPKDLKVKPGDKISAGQVLSDRISERNRLQARKKQLQLSLLKLNLPLTPIPQPKPIPEIAKLPPISYAESEAAIKLKQQQLTVAERAIALQQKKIDSLKQLNAKPATDKDSKASPLLRGTEGDLKLILEHEQANLKNLEAAQQSAQIQLEVQESKLTTAKEQRAYIEYQRQLEQTRRAIAVEQQQQAIQRQESERERLLAEREYSQAQIETQIQTLDYQIEQLSTVHAPYNGTIKKIKWTGQNNNNLTAVVTLSVTSQQSAVSSNNRDKKPISGTQTKQTTQTQP